MRNTPSPERIVFHHRARGSAGRTPVVLLRPLLEAFCQKLDKRARVRTLEVYLHEPKNAAGQPVVYEVMLHVHFASGARYVAKASQLISKAKRVGLETAIRQAMREIEEQLRRMRR